MKRQLDDIQMLRAVAAIAVLVYHTERELLALHPGDIAVLFTGVAWIGQFGVDIFFVISGFIMYYVHGTDFSRRGAVRSFVLRRLIRIVPSYWLLTTVSVVALAVMPSVFHSRVLDWPWVAASYLFVPWTAPNGIVAPVVGPGWTLNYEMFFYLVFGALLLLPRRAALIAMAAIFAGLALLGLVLQPAAPILALVTSSMLLEFLLGAVLGWLFLQRVTLPGGLRFALLAAALAILSATPWIYRTGLLDTVWRLGFFGVPAAAIMAAVVLRDEELGAPRRTGLLSRGFVAVGNSSYALYLTHIFSLRIIALVLERGLPMLPIPLAFLLLAAGAIVAGHLFYLWFDRPVYQWLKRRLPGVRLAAVAT